MMQVFTENDATLRRCRQNEIGMPWEDRFSVEDYLNGMCTSEQVGQSKEQLPTPDMPEPDQEQLPDMPDFVFDREMADYRRNPAEYKARNPPALVVKLLAVDEDRRTRKIQNEKPKRPETMSNAELVEAITPELNAIVRAGKADFMVMLERALDRMVTHAADGHARQHAQADAGIILIGFRRLFEEAETPEKRYG